MLSCKKATELIERKQIEELDLVKEIQLKFHLAVCSACKSYSKQSKEINKILELHINRNADNQKFNIKTKNLTHSIINKINQYDSDDGKI